MFDPEQIETTEVREPLMTEQKRRRGRPPLTEEERKKKLKKRPSRRVEALLENDEVFSNFMLTPEDAAILKRAAVWRGTAVRRTIFPLVLIYLRDRAQPADRGTVLRVEALVKDRYWGTEREVLEPRKLPEGLVKLTVERPKSTQQILERKSRIHLRAIEEYYGCSTGDLVSAALSYAAEMMG